MLGISNPFLFFPVTFLHFHFRFISNTNPSLHNQCMLRDENGAYIGYEAIDYKSLLYKMMRKNILLQKKVIYHVTNEISSHHHRLKGTQLAQAYLSNIFLQS
jgi:hypothetical protein